MRSRILTAVAVTGLVAASPMLTAGAAVASTAPGVFSTAHRVVHRSPAPAPTVTAIRVGHHATFDRVVIQLTGSHAPGFDVKYVRQLVADPSGKKVDLLGAADLQLVVTPANAHDLNTGASTLTSRSRTKWRLDEIRETAVIGDTEGVFTLGVGLHAKSPFRVLTLHNPLRIVVDVQH